MIRVRNPNLALLEKTVAHLAELADEMVFVGGCATGLLIADLAAPPIRVTKDVDAIVQAVSYADYQHLAEKLRAKGFSESAEDSVICRWRSQELILDVMPIDEKVLGFGNKWYRSAAEHAMEMSLPFSERKIRVIKAPHFLLTKLDAFNGRGNNDYLLSHDIEDIVAVVDGRPGLVEEVRHCEPDVIDALAVSFSQLLQDDRFVESIPGHLPPDSTSSQRVPGIIVVLSAIANM